MYTTTVFSKLAPFRKFNIMPVFQKIAHQTSYMTDVDYIETLIESEKSETKPGIKNKNI